MEVFDMEVTLKKIKEEEAKAIVKIIRGTTFNYSANHYC